LFSFCISYTITFISLSFSGRQAAGGHDVIGGLFDAMSEADSLLGFVGGTKGMFNGDVQVLDADTIAPYRGQGGYELLGRSADTIKASDFEKVARVCSELALTGLVIIGGARSCTDAAYLAEYLKANACHTAVVAIPADMGCSIRNQFVETTIGFDTSTKISAQIVGNNATDGASAKKYYYFQRLMGQEPSQTALEVALLTKPNYVILGEEVKAKNMSLQDVVKSIADVVEERARRNMNYGTVLIPEGLIESIPEFRMLMQELDEAHATLHHKSAPAAHDAHHTNESADSTAAPKRSRSLSAKELGARLTVWSRALLFSLPDYIQSQLLFERCESQNKVSSQLRRRA
jgi:diphosphate--fructose-6-phosphate 1-phosphotransferase